MPKDGIKTIPLAGTAVLGALTVIFDYTLKFSGFKIPFPWLTYLKFDFTGIPIVLSLLLYGLSSGTITSTVAFLAILVRSGDFVSASMKGLAEFSTIFGVAIGLRLPEKFRKATSFALGILLRCIVMSLASIIILPQYYGMPIDEAILLIPVMAVFNIMQGILSILGGYFIYETLKRSSPSLIKTT